MVAKTVYDANWKPSIGTFVILVAAAAGIMYLPYKLQLPIYVNPLLALVLEIAFCIGSMLFFYVGVPRGRLVRICSVQVIFYSLFGIFSNLFHQATFLVSSRVLSSDYLILGLVNVAAVALTLSCYQVKTSRVEVSEDSLKMPTSNLQNLKVLTPVVVLLPVAIFTFLILNARYVPNGATFAINVWFFIAAQIVLNIGGGFYMFKTKPRAEKVRLSFSVAALAMLYGTMSNLNNHVTMLRPGFRLMLSSSEFILWNAGAIITAIVFVKWMEYVAAEKAKHQAFAAPALESVSTPPAPGEPVETPDAAPEATPPTTKTGTETSSAPGTGSAADSSQQTVGGESSDTVVETQTSKST
jgi:hypothetical protein